MAKNAIETSNAHAQGKMIGDDKYSARAGYAEEAYKYESIFQRDGWHYDIDCPQCSPFLPEKIEIVALESLK